MLCRSLRSLTRGATLIAILCLAAFTAFAQDPDFDGLTGSADRCPNWPTPEPSGSDPDGNADAGGGIGRACLCGDVTDDGVINQADADAFWYSVGNARPTSRFTLTELLKCDVSGDGVCTAYDGELIANSLDTNSSNDNYYIRTRCPDLEIVSQRLLNRIGYGLDDWSRDRILELQEDANTPVVRADVDPWEGIHDYVLEQLSPSTSGVVDEPFATIQFEDYSDGGTGLYPTIGHDIAYIRPRYCASGTTGCTNFQDNAPRTRANTSEVKLLRSVYSRNQLAAVLLDFWFNHFNIFAGGEGFNPFGVHLHEEKLAEYMFGPFEELVWESAKTHAMLDYLDLRDSKLGNMNENFGREVMELHTIGLSRDTDGLPGSDLYTYDKTVDQAGANIVAVSRILTGITFSISSPFAYFFDYDLHDTRWKYAQNGIPESSYTRMEVVIGDPDAPTPPTPWISGDLDTLANNSSCGGHQAISWGPTSPAAEAFICMLARHPASADNVGRKLIKRFLGDEADFIAGTPALQSYSTGDAEFVLLDKIESVWSATDANLPDVMEVLFGVTTDATYTNDDFFRSLFYGDNKIKRPSAYYASTLRALGTSQISLATEERLEGSSDLVSNSYTQARENDAFNGVIGDLQTTGEKFFFEPAPTGYSEESTAWTGAATTISHFNTSARLILGEQSSGGMHANIHEVVDRLDIDSCGIPASTTDHQQAENLVSCIADRIGQPLEKSSLNIIANYMRGYDTTLVSSADLTTDCINTSDCITVWTKRALLGIFSSPEFRAH